MIDRFKDTFLEECNENLGSLETLLLELESEQGNQETIDSIFRHVHSIKGSAGMFGYTNVSRFTHELETLLDAVRNGIVCVDKQLVSLVLRAKDAVRGMLALPAGSAELTEEAEEILLKVKELQPKEEGRNGKTGPEKPLSGENESSESFRHYRISFEPEEKIYRFGARPCQILEELAELGTMRSFCHTERIPPLSELEADLFYIHWDILLSTDRTENEVRDVFIFYEDRARITIDRLDPGDEGMHPLLGEILLGRKEVDPQTLREALAEQKPLGRILTEKHGIPSSKIEAALGEQEVRSSSPQKPAGEAASIRVRAEKLDDLMNLVGEIVTVQTQLFQTVRGHRDKHLYGMVEHLGRLSSELRNNTMSIRMVPIGTLFGRFHRIVRDLSLEMKKEAALEIEGAETELDKTVIEKLNDPLVHLLRNSLDHGIEHPKKRETAGKPAKGRIFLRARYAGAFVEIIVEDDGAGLDVKRVTEKAVRQGLIPAGTSLTDAEAFRHIFLPGFSTAERVTGISGRGVGMDVVKQAVEALGGSVHGESFSGKGTRFSLQIPLTLAIIDGFLVRSGTTVFVIPLVAVEKCRELPQIAGPAGRRILDVEGVSVPYFVLRERFEIPGDPPERQEMVVLRMPEGRIGVVVDQIIGGHQTVVKPLGDIAKAGIGISEATVLGDGSLAFILDINKL